MQPCLLLAGLTLLSHLFPVSVGVGSSTTNAYAPGARCAACLACVARTLLLVYFHRCLTSAARALLTLPNVSPGAPGARSAACIVCVAVTISQPPDLRCQCAAHAAFITYQRITALHSTNRTARSSPTHTFVPLLPLLHLPAVSRYHANAHAQMHNNRLLTGSR
jgi:hypothetical protein